MLNRCATASIVLASFSWLCFAGPIENTNSFRFDFGAGTVASGYVQVLPDSFYTRERGWGFEPRGKVSSLDRGGDSLCGDFCTSDKPFSFSVALPEGDYQVTAVFGDAVGESTNTVKAESRRLMLESLRTARGAFATNRFTVNVRGRKIPAGGAVKLKPREEDYLHWDDKLSLEFNGARPCVAALEITRVDDAITVYLLGDSTVTDQPLEPWNSWGQMLPRFFKPGVSVANHAESGESIQSSLGARRVDKVFSTLQRGDYVFVQFGHNDMKSRATGALTTYKSDLRQLVTKVREHGATPVLITSMERKGGVERDTLGDYPKTVRDVAREMETALIDLHAMSRIFYKALGANIGAAFQDGTHHNNYGSYELAKCVVEGIKGNRLPLAKFIADDVPAFDPAQPDPVESFIVPRSLESDSKKPDGN